MHHPHMRSSYSYTLAVGCRSESHCHIVRLSGPGMTWLLICLAILYYRVSQKCPPYTFINNFNKCGLLSIIFGTLWNSLNISLSAGYLNVCMPGGAFDRRWLKARRINGLTYLLTQNNYLMSNYTYFRMNSDKNKEPVRIWSMAVIVCISAP